MRASIFAAVLRVMLLLSMLAACERAKDAGSDDVVETKLSATDVKITLVEPGREPRRPMRSLPPAGAKKSYRAELTFLHDGGDQMRTRMRQDSEVVGVDGGVVHGRQTVRAIEQVPRDESTPLPPIGMTIDSWLDGRGIEARRSVARASRKLESDTVDGFPELTLAFPEEPIGEGARWRLDVTTSDMRAAVEVELTSWRGERFHQRFSYRTTVQVPYSITYAGTGEIEGTLHTLDLKAWTTGTFKVDANGETARGTRRVEIAPD
jgi:hypothetical protein